MNIKNRLEKLEAKKEQVEQITQSNYTQEQHEESEKLFEELFGIKVVDLLRRWDYDYQK